MNVLDIKNDYVRRAVLVVAIIPMVLVGCGFLLCEFFRVASHEIPRDFMYAWRSEENR